MFFFLIGYRFVMRVCWTLMPILALFHKKLKKRLVVEKGQDLPFFSSSVVFHAASLGEYEQAIPIIRVFAQESDLPIVVSFFSSSGYQYALKSPLPEVAFYTYLPWDVPDKINAWYQKINPKKMVFIKYELWYELMRFLSQKKVELYLFAAVFYRGHFLSRSLGKPYLKLLQQFKKITVQNESSLRFLESLGVSQVEVELDPRYDRVNQQWENEPQKVKKLKKIIPKDKPMVVLGSVWMSDIKVLREAIITLAKTHRLLIAPHDVSEKNINKMVDFLGLESTFYSNWDASQPMNKVFWVDAIGGLKYLYELATFSYVGGGFHRAGIHNVLESLVYGTPVVVGVRHQKFPEIDFLALHKAVFVVANQQQFQETVMKITADLTAIRQSTKRLMNTQLGGGEKHAKHLV